MARDQELDQLKQEGERAFHWKQVAFQRYDELRQAASAAHDAMETAWQARLSAREEMNREFEARKAAFRDHDTIWDEYGRIRDYNNMEISRLRAEADAEHAAMQDAFDRASNAYECGDKAEAPYLAAEGRAHKERRDELNAEIQALVQEIKDAKAHALYYAPPVDSSAFLAAKDRFEATRARHEEIQAYFKQMKTARDEAKNLFDQWRAEHERLKKAYQERLATVRAMRAEERAAREREREARGQYRRETISEQRAGNRCSTLAAGTDVFDGRPAKVRHRADGRTDIFFSSSGNYGDSLGHGHVVLAKDGHVAYYRDQWQDKNQGQYLIDESKDDHTRI